MCSLQWARDAACPCLPIPRHHRQAGADIHATSGIGRTALVAAIQHGCAPAAMALLEAGADPSAADANGCSPLIMSAQARLTQLVAPLLVRCALRRPPIARRLGAGRMRGVGAATSLPLVKPCSWLH